MRQAKTERRRFEMMFFKASKLVIRFFITIGEKVIVLRKFLPRLVVAAATAAAVVVVAIVAVVVVAATATAAIK